MTTARYIQRSRHQREQFWKRATPAQAQEMWDQLPERYRKEAQLLAVVAGVSAAAFTLGAGLPSSSTSDLAPAAASSSSGDGGPASAFPEAEDLPPPYELNESD